MWQIAAILHQVISTLRGTHAETIRDVPSTRITRVAVFMSSSTQELKKYANLVIYVPICSRADVNFAIYSLAW